MIRLCGSTRAKVSRDREEVRTIGIGITHVVRPAQGSCFRITAGFYPRARRRWRVPAWARTPASPMVRPESEKVSTWQRSSTQSSQDTDEQPFKDFFMRYRPDIYGYLWRIIGEEQVAQDLCQETFLRAWQHFGKVSAYERPVAWLFRVATNLAINYQRHRSTSNDRLLKPQEHESCGVDPTLGIVERDAVASALQALPPRQ